MGRFTALQDAHKRFDITAAVYRECRCTRVHCVHYRQLAQAQQAVAEALIALRVLEKQERFASQLYEDLLHEVSSPRRCR
jgi:hypothetical protein